MLKTQVKGKIALSSQSSLHPLQTNITLILTDFLPNGNRQGIPYTERENITQSAMYMPIKINFDGSEYHGHTGAIPLGPIISVYEGKDDTRDVIYADAIVWDEMYDNVSEHLKSALSEGLSTSWEIFYETSEIDDQGVEWLHGCVFAGTCIVEVPAYGPNRTRILAIAEKMYGENMAKDNVGKVEDVAMSDVSDVQNDVLDAQDVLFQIWDGLDQLYSKLFDLEAQNVEKNLETIAQSFADKITQIVEQVNELKASLASANESVATLQSEKATLAQSNARDKVLAERTRVLAEHGIVWSKDEYESRIDQLATMSDVLFTMYVTDMKKSSKSSAERIRLPEPILGDNKNIDINDLIKAFS